MIVAKDITGEYWRHLSHMNAQLRDERTSMRRQPATPVMMVDGSVPERVEQRRGEESTPTACCRCCVVSRHGGRFDARDGCMRQNWRAKKFDTRESSVSESRVSFIVVLVNQRVTGFRF